MCTKFEIRGWGVGAQLRFAALGRGGRGGGVLY
jgi:hypothetical protein